MATVLELIDAEIEAFHSNVETGSLDDKSPRHSASLVEESSFPGCGRITAHTDIAQNLQFCPDWRRSGSH